MSAHLGSRVSSLIDGQLDAAGTDRALSHLAGCPDCTREVRSARATRHVLSRGLDDVSPAPEFMNRLRALAVEPDPTLVATTCFTEVREQLPPRWQALCGDLSSSDLSRRDAAGGVGVGDPRRRKRRITAALVLTGVAASGLFALGARPVVTPARHPADAFTALAGAVAQADGPNPTVMAGAGVARGGDVADFDHAVLEWMRAEGWPRPDALPAGLQVAALRFTGSEEAVLEVDLESPIGDVVIREQKGQLSPARLDELESVAVGGAPVYVISAAPVHLVWQSSDTVIDLVSASSLDDVLQLVSTFSVDEFDTGFQARVERGWSTLTGVLS